jgi:hypothetical protein
MCIRLPVLYLPLSCSDAYPGAAYPLQLHQLLNKVQLGFGLHAIRLLRSRAQQKTGCGCTCIAQSSSILCASLQRQLHSPQPGRAGAHSGFGHSAAVQPQLHRYLSEPPGGVQLAAAAAGLLDGPGGGSLHGGMHSRGGGLSPGARLTLPCSRGRLYRQVSVLACL